MHRREGMPPKSFPTDVDRITTVHTLLLWCKEDKGIAMRKTKPIRPIAIRDGKCYIPLTKGYIAICDEVDYTLVARYNWAEEVSTSTSYACAWLINAGRGKSVRMHRILMGVTDPKIQVDHKDGNGLNNCRDNIRLATHAQNQRNRRMCFGNKSGYKGVYSKGKKWKVGIQVLGKSFNLGTFDTKEEAAIAYNEAAREHFGEFARLNDIEEVSLTKVGLQNKSTGGVYGREKEVRPS